MLANSRVTPSYALTVGNKDKKAENSLTAKHPASRKQNSKTIAFLFEVVLWACGTSLKSI